MFPYQITVMTEEFNHIYFHDDYFLLHFDVYSPYLEASSLWIILNNISDELDEFCVFSWTIVEVFKLCLLAFYAEC